MASLTRLMGSSEADGQSYVLLSKLSSLHQIDVIGMSRSRRDNTLVADSQQWLKLLPMFQGHPGISARGALLQKYSAHVHLCSRKLVRYFHVPLSHDTECMP